jgi:hypothetical protein
MRYYSKSQAWCIGVFGVLCGLIVALIGVGLAQQHRAAHSAAVAPFEIAAVVCGLALVVASIRAASAGAIVKEDRLKVRNLFSSVILPKASVDSFSLGQSGIYRYVGRAHLRDGSVLRIWGIQGSRIGNNAAQREIDELNIWLSGL